MRILVALSGGIDSSVVAHLLAEQGHELIGVRFTLWTDPIAPPLAQILPSKCCNAQTAARSAAVARQLGIPLHIIDLEDAFKAEVIDPFLEGYLQGRTPNPCIGCNRTIKFGKLLEVAEAHSCEALATGHYARIARRALGNGRHSYGLLEALDRTKDQSYYLYGLSQKQLSRCLFPLGNRKKSDVYILARRYNVPLDDHYRESQDLCFFPEKTPRAFLRRHLPNAIVPGAIVHRDGHIVGTHQGIPLYTIGQRKGLGIGGLRVPLEVIAKDVSRNQLIVAEQHTELIRSVGVHELHWIAATPPKNGEMALECRVRSLSPRLRGTLSFKDSLGVFVFEEPISPQAQDQALVLYHGEEVLGGAFID